MNCTIPVLTIDAQDCLGDSLGKHNYNALALDTTICNLSSLIYNNKTNVSSIFNVISSLLVSYAPLEVKYNNDKLNHVLTSSTTVNLLSSFWGKYSFSVQYPLNSISLSDENLSVLAPTLSTVNVQNIESLIQNRLITLANIFLQENYNPNNFSDNTIINVVFFLYNLVPTLNDNSNLKNDSLTQIYTINSDGSASNVFNFNQRVLYPTFNRDNVHLTTGVTLNYYIQNGKWNYGGYIIDDAISKAENVLNPAITTVSTNLPTSITTSTVLSPSQSNSSNCIPLVNNKYYPVSNYISFRCLVTGTSINPATATLDFLETNKQLTSYSYTAKGYDGNSGNGGTDVWLEFNSITSIISVYEQNPGPKTLVNTFNYTLANEIGVNFKFTSKNGVNISSCGVLAIGV
jgi:hypothetical protein